MSAKTVYGTGRRLPSLSTMMTKEKVESAFEAIDLLEQAKGAICVRLKQQGFWSFLIGVSRRDIRLFYRLQRAQAYIADEYLDGFGGANFYR